ncbi:HAD family hydrolase [Parabacteroides sp. 52]|uniref:HAD family hydrolase n=1 Tax=unclassified Parabacteroides TaxID=2649774 RepID=UPI0013D7F013|nr:MULTISPECIES: HAD family hydrolase [unclassified Parabacteroides]MDH6533951.1 HAD superfamily hydrolase (TIGR01509 family) [Parabacteroides sp. PM5-20]NDV54695.1 HAD family hydrolase [Parabacteroides sp. 52]
MFEAKKVKGIIFDYGGTIDSNGMHWAEVIWMAYETLEIPVNKETFRQAYVYGERTLGKNPIIQPHHTFLDMLLLKSELQIQWLQEQGHLSSHTLPAFLPARIADWCYAYAQKAINAARPLLEHLAKEYPLVLVSNFYGNIESVLKDFQLEHLFVSIVESAVVGIRKPDPAIFALGVKELALPAENILVIGDSHDKDIIPAQTIGCQTVWLKSIGWSDYKGDETADVIISDFTELNHFFPIRE